MSGTEGGAMKRHSGISPFFLEMVFVLLFLSLSCAVLLRLFSAARTTAERSAKLNAAMVLAQSAAEKVQSAQTPAEVALLFRSDRHGRKGGSDLYTAFCDADGNPAARGAAFRVEKAVRASPAAPGTMLEAKITVFSGDETLFALSTKKYCPDRESSP